MSGKIERSTNFLDETSLQRWVTSRVGQARAIAQKLADLRDQMQSLPLDREDARRRIVRQRICEIFGIPNDTALSPVHFQAAVMLGRGLTVDEVAVTLGVGPGDIYAMMTDDFRAVVRHWREQTLEEYFSVIIRRYDELIQKVTDPNICVKILKELRELAGYSENRRRWEAEFELREREVAAREHVVDVFARQAGQWELPPGSVDVIDVELIEAEDQDDESDD